VTLHSVQAVAGVVHLPLTSATQINETSTYSLVLVQLPALPLALGMSESTLAVLLSGVQGAVFFGAVVTVCLALSENTLLAALAPFLVIQLDSVPGHQYPVSVVASHYEDAVLGLFAALLTVGLLAMRRARSGLFLLGVLPAIHVSYGIACLIFTAAGLGAAQRTHLAPLRAAWKYFAGGVAVFAVSFGVQVLAIRHVPAGIDMHRAESVVRDFIQNWDVHRRPAGFFGAHPERLLTFFEADVFLFLLAAGLLLLARTRLPADARFLIPGLASAAAVAVVYKLVQEVAPDQMPLWLHGLMITRWLNMDTIVLPLLVLATLSYLGFQRQQPLALGALALCAIVMASGFVDLTPFASSWDGFPVNDRISLEPTGLLFPIATVAALALLIAAERGSPATSNRQTGGRLVTAGVLAAMLLAAIAGYVVPRSLSNHARLKTVSGVGTSSDRAFLGRIGHRPGLLFVAPGLDFYLPQFHSRRGPVLDIDQLNYMTYVPESGPPSERALREAYNTSVSDPDGGTFAGTRRIWERRSPVRWRALRREFQGTDVLVPRSWRLRLHLVGSSDNLRLYSIA